MNILGLWLNLVFQGSGLFNLPDGGSGIKGNTQLAQANYPYHRSNTGRYHPETPSQPGSHEHPYQEVQSSYDETGQPRRYPPLTTNGGLVHVEVDSQNSRADSAEIIQQQQNTRGEQHSHEDDIPSGQESSGTYKKGLQQYHVEAQNEQSDGKKQGMHDGNLGKQLSTKLPDHEQGNATKQQQQTTVATTKEAVSEYRSDNEQSFPQQIGESEHHLIQQENLKSQQGLDQPHDDQLRHPQVPPAEPDRQHQHEHYQFEEQSEHPMNHEQGEMHSHHTEQGIYHHQHRLEDVDNNHRLPEYTGEFHQHSGSHGSYYHRHPEEVFLHRESDGQYQNLDNHKGHQNHHRLQHEEGKTGYHHHHSELLGMYYHQHERHKVPYNHQQSEETERTSQAVEYYGDVPSRAGSYKQQRGQQQPVYAMQLNQEAERLKQRAYQSNNGQHQPFAYFNNEQSAAFNPGQQYHSLRPQYQGSGFQQSPQVTSDFHQHQLHQRLRKQEQYRNPAMYSPGIHQASQVQSRISRVSQKPQSPNFQKLRHSPFSEKQQIQKAQYGGRRIKPENFRLQSDHHASGALYQQHQRLGNQKDYRYSPMYNPGNRQVQGHVSRLSQRQQNRQPQHLKQRYSQNEQNQNRQRARRPVYGQLERFTPRNMKQDQQLLTARSQLFSQRKSNRGGNYELIGNAKLTQVNVQHPALKTKGRHQYQVSEEFSIRRKAQQSQRAHGIGGQYQSFYKPSIHESRTMYHPTSSDMGYVQRMRESIGKSNTADVFQTHGPVRISQNNRDHKQQQQQQQSFDIYKSHGHPGNEYNPKIPLHTGVSNYHPYRPSGITRETSHGASQHTRGRSPPKYVKSGSSNRERGPTGYSQRELNTRSKVSQEQQKTMQNKRKEEERKVRPVESAIQGIGSGTKDDQLNTLITHEQINGDVEAYNLTTPTTQSLPASEATTYRIPSSEATTRKPPDSVLRDGFIDQKKSSATMFDSVERDSKSDPSRARRTEVLVQRFSDPVAVYQDYDFHNLPRGVDTKAAGCEWKLVFKAVAGNERIVYVDFIGGGNINTDTPIASEITNDLVYRDGFVLDNWDHLVIEQVRIEIFDGGLLKAWFLFEASGSTLENWMSQDRLIAAPYEDIRTGSFSWFSMEGDVSESRRFLIKRIHTNCDEGCGYLVVADSNTGSPCAWETVDTNPLFLYRSGQDSCEKSPAEESNTYERGDRFVIKAKVCDGDL